MKPVWPYRTKKKHHLFFIGVSEKVSQDDTQVQCKRRREEMTRQEEME